jgi:hypothetical protein
MPTSVIRPSIGISRWENQLPPQPKLRRWITAKDGTHYEMYGNFRTPDLDDIRCQVGRHTLVFCGFSHEPGTGLPGVFAERGKRTGGNSHPVLHWLLLGHVEQFEFCRPLIFGETTDPERGVVSVQFLNRLP